MGAHDHVGPGLDAGPERHQLQGVELRVARGDDRQADVGVALRVAVAGEVLQRRQHPVVTQAVDVGLHELRDRSGVFPKRAGVDDRVERVVVEIGVGGEVDVDADRPAFHRRGLPDRVGVLGVARRADRHERREDGGAHEPHPRAPLEIRRHQQRQPGAALQHVDLGGNVERRPGEHDEAAELERVHPALRHRVRGIVERTVVSREPGHHDLSYLLVGGEPGEQ